MDGSLLNPEAGGKGRNGHVPRDEYTGSSGSSEPAPETAASHLPAFHRRRAIFAVLRSPVLVTKGGGLQCKTLPSLAQPLPSFPNTPKAMRAPTRGSNQSCRAGGAPGLALAHLLDLRHSPRAVDEFSHLQWIRLPVTMDSAPTGPLPSAPVPRVTYPLVCHDQGQQGHCLPSA